MVLRWILKNNTYCTFVHLRIIFQTPPCTTLNFKNLNKLKTKLIKKYDNRLFYKKQNKTYRL